MNPPRISDVESMAFIRNDHFLKSRIFSVPIIPVIRRNNKIMSDSTKNKIPYSMNASQKPPRILSESVITEECRDSSILAAINITAIKIKAIEKTTLLF
jgi:hypothetical protein